MAGDPDILLVPDLEAGNMLAKQLSFLANADSAGLVLGARVPIILTSRADSVRSRIASCAVALMLLGASAQDASGGDVGDVDNGRLCTRTERRLIEPEVLRLPAAASAKRGDSKRAGRSRASERRLDFLPRTAPARDCLTTQLDNASVRDARSALDALATWLRSKYGGARVLGVGHRVVHGGARLRGPTSDHPQVLAELRKLIPLAPLHQPHNLAAIEAVCERFRACRRSPASTRAFIAGNRRSPNSFHCRARFASAGVQRYGFHGLSYEYIASVLPHVAPEIADGRVIVAHLGSGASLCAMKNGKSVDSTLGFTALDGLCMGTRPGALDPGVVLISFRARTVGQGSRDNSLQEIRTARHLRNQQRHARPARQQ